MKCLHSRDEWAIYLCDCGEEFEVDAISERTILRVVSDPTENFTWRGKEK